MNNWNGWYSLENITDLETLKQLYTDALTICVDAICDVKNEHYRQVYDPTITPEEWIRKYLTLQTHNVVCNRFEYNGRASWADQRGEFGSCTMTLPKDKFLWIWVSLEDLQILVDKYKLEKI